MTNNLLDREAGAVWISGGVARLVLTHLLDCGARVVVWISGGVAGLVLPALARVTLAAKLVHRFRQRRVRLVRDAAKTHRTCITHPDICS